MAEPTKEQLEEWLALVPSRLISLLNAYERLASALPRTADGVIVVPGMMLYWHSESPESIQGVEVTIIDTGGAYFRSHGEVLGVPLEWAMSTPEAAQEARKNSSAAPDDGGKTQ